MKKIKNINFYIIICLLIHLIASIFSYGAYNPDEHFCILEYVNHKLNFESDSCFSYYNLRSWFQPLVYFLLIKILILINIFDPFDWSLILRIFSSLLGFFSIIIIIKKNQNIFFTNSAKYFFTLTLLFFWFFPFFHARTSSVNFSVSFLFIAISLLLSSNNIVSNSKKKYLFLCGIFFGLSFISRYQIGIMIFFCITWLLIFKKNSINEIIIILMGLVIIIVLEFFINVWGYQKYNSGYGFQLFGHPLPYFNYLKFNLEDNAYMGNAHWWSYFSFTLNRFFPPLSLFVIFIFLYIWIFLPKNLISWLTLPYLIIHILIPHKELRFMFPIFAFFPFAIGYAIDDFFIKKKYVFNIINKTTIKKIFYFLFALNILGLITIFVPANSSYRFYKNFFELDNINHFYYFNNRLLEPGEQKNPFYEGDHELHFYNRFEYINYDMIENEQIENTIVFKKIIEIDENKISSNNNKIYLHIVKNSVDFNDLNNGEYWIIVSQWNYIKKLMKLNCSMEFSSFPSWVFKLNINNWLSRTDIKTMFKCKFH